MSPKRLGLSLISVYRTDLFAILANMNRFNKLESLFIDKSSTIQRIKTVPLKCKVPCKYSYNYTRQYMYIYAYLVAYFAVGNLTLRPYASNSAMRTDDDEFNISLGYVQGRESHKIHCVTGSRLELILPALGCDSISPAFEPSVTFVLCKHTSSVNIS